MAQLVRQHAVSMPEKAWTQRQTWAQFRAVAWLRWRMLVNITRRTNKPGEIIGRVVLGLVMLTFAVGLTFAAGLAGWICARSGHLDRLWIVFWIIFGLCQFLNINLGQPGTTFNPTDLIRFPLRVPTYVAVRLFFNLLSPANVMAMLMSLAVALSVSVVVPRITLYALVACLLFGLTNVLFSRMIFAWVDRWLSTRRAREVFTFAILFFSLGFQYVNFRFNPGFNHSRHHTSAVTRHRMEATRAWYERAAPYVRFLPPELTSSGLSHALGGEFIGFAANLEGCAAYGAVFFGVFALRTRTEFYGESLSDVASGVSAKHEPIRVRVAPPQAAALQNSLKASTNSTFTPAAGREMRQWLSPTVAGVLRKEWIYMRRNIGLLYGLVTPLFLVVMAALKFGRNAPSAWVLPIALMYSLLGIAPLSYNSFGLEGTGAQLYFLAPIQLRTVFVAKNLMHFGTALVEIIAVLGVLTYIAGIPNPLMLCNVLLWATGTLLLNTALGNRRSVSAPKKINLGRMAGKQASQTSALLALGVLLACDLYGGAVLEGAAYFNVRWAALACFAALVLAGVLVYRKSLMSIEQFTLDHRDSLFEELGKS